MNNCFTEILRNYVLEQRRKNPRVSESSISKKIGISQTTFNRLINGYSTPSVKNFLKLLQYIPELKKALPIEISQTLKVISKTEQEQHIEGILETLLSDKYIFLCWILSFAEKGITTEEIKKRFGQQGLTALETLVKKNIILKNESNSYKVSTETKDVILSADLMKSHLMFLVEQYNPDNLNSTLHCLVGSLNESGTMDLITAHWEFHKKVQKIMNNKYNKGDTLVFSTACSDLLLKSTSF